LFCTALASEIRPTSVHPRLLRSEGASCMLQQQIGHCLGPILVQPRACVRRIRRVLAVGSDAMGLPAVPAVARPRERCNQCSPSGPTQRQNCSTSPLGFWAAASPPGKLRYQFRPNSLHHCTYFVRDGLNDGRFNCSDGSPAIFGRLAANDPRLIREAPPAPKRAPQPACSESPVASNLSRETHLNANKPCRSAGGATRL
jgi:hypothetical protein